MQRMKAELDRYVFHFERYNNHSKSKKHAKDMAPAIENAMARLHLEKSYSFSELQFLHETLKVLIRARHALKYTYVEAYYLLDKDH